MSAIDIDLRKLRLAYGQLLKRGKCMKIYAGETDITKVSRSLFVASSTEADMLAGDIVKLPSNIDLDSVTRLIDYLPVKRLITSPSSNLRMSNNISYRSMLSVTATAEVLGMNKYVDHIYRKYEAPLRGGAPVI
jgi:hypothetical protein